MILLLLLSQIAFCSDIQIIEENDTCGIAPCTMCKWITTEIGKWISKNSTSHEISHYLNVVCNKVPKSSKSKCEDFVEDNFDKLLASISVSNISEVCPMIKMCPEERNKSTTFLCDACTWTINGLEMLIKNNRTIEFISSVATSFCAAFPGPVSSLCSLVLRDSIVEIIHLLANNINSKRVCSLLTMCRSNTISEEEKQMVINLLELEIKRNIESQSEELVSETSDGISLDGEMLMNLSKLVEMIIIVYNQEALPENKLKSDELMLLLLASLDPTFKEMSETKEQPLLPSQQLTTEAASLPLFASLSQQKSRMEQICSLNLTSVRSPCNLLVNSKSI